MTEVETSDGKCRLIINRRMRITKNRANMNIYLATSNLVTDIQLPRCK